MNLTRVQRLAQLMVTFGRSYQTVRRLGTQTLASQNVRLLRNSQILRRRMSQFSSMSMNGRNMIVRMDLTGFKKENISIQVEGSWLVVEVMTTKMDDENAFGGYVQKHIMRRYELPSNAIVSRITSELDEQNNVLVITVPVGPTTPIKIA